MHDEPQSRHVGPHGGQALAYVYFEEEPGRRAAAKLLNQRRGAADGGELRQTAGAAAKAAGVGPSFRGASLRTFRALWLTLLGMVKKLSAFLKDQTAATAIEYALIAAGISIVIVAAVNGIGTKLNTTFSSVSTQLK